MKKLMNHLLNYVVKSRRTPNKSRERIDQNLMILAVFLFLVFIINSIIIIGTDAKFGHNLPTEASEVYQQTVTIQTKHGTTYDRNGIALVEDSITHNIYAIVSASYVSPTGEKLYTKKSQYEKMTGILNEQLGIDRGKVLNQLKRDGLFQVSLGNSGPGLSYGIESAIETVTDEASIKGIGFTSTSGHIYPNGTFASQFLGLA